MRIGVQITGGVCGSDGARSAAFIAFAAAPISRADSVAARRSLIFGAYDGNQQAFLDFVLGHYVRQGVAELGEAKLPHLLELKYHAVSATLEELGSAAEIREIFIGFQQHLYARKLAA